MNIKLNQTLTCRNNTYYTGYIFDEINLLNESLQKELANFLKKRGNTAMEGTKEAIKFLKDITKKQEKEELEKKKKASKDKKPKRSNIIIPAESTEETKDELEMVETLSED